MTSTASAPAVRRLTPEQVSVRLDGAPPPADHTALRDLDVLILVGLTGAGKSSAVEGLAARGAIVAVLPDRRAVTDHVILPAMTGDPARQVTDRIERFRLTAAFRERHPGGMGEVLEHLSVTAGGGAGSGADGWHLFDGVRGAAEVTAAARLPRARFAVLTALPETRVARISLRGDPFDQATLTRSAAAQGSAGRAAIRSALRDNGIDALVESARLDRLAEVLAQAAADPAAVAAAAKIVAEEARHYDPAEALTVLRDLAPDRTVVIDTGKLGVDDVVDRLSAGLVRPR